MVTNMKNVIRRRTHGFVTTLLMMMVLLCSFECSDLDIEPVLPENPSEDETEETIAPVPVITADIGDKPVPVYDMASGVATVVEISIADLVEDGQVAVLPGEGLSASLTEDGDGCYTLSVCAGEGFSGRQSVVLSACNGDRKAELSIIFCEASLSLGRNSINAAYDGGTYEVPLNATVTPYAECGCDWISIAIEDSRVLVTVTENTTGTFREAVVTLKDQYEQFKEEILVHQSRESVTLEKERAALIAVYNALGGENWNDSENWCSDKDLNDWAGVSVGNYNGERHVQYLHIQCQNAVGELPDEIGDLEYLTELIITKEPGITGGIPESFRNFKRIREISITSTSMSGDLPECLGELKSLGYLNLKGNCFTGSFPLWLLDMPDLYNFGFQQNCFHGEIPVEFTQTTWWNTEASNTGEKLGEGQLRIGQKEGYRLWIEGCEDFLYGYDDGSAVNTQ